MISDLDNTISKLLIEKATEGTELKQADISFEIPDADWRIKLKKPTVNCYLYDIHENVEMRTHEAILQYNEDKTKAAYRQPPVRIDCVYCITAWDKTQSESVAVEHKLLSQVLKILLQNRKIEEKILQGDLVNQIPPYPTVIALPDGIKNQPQFWGALDQQLKPSLNYCVTLAMMLDDVSTKEVEVVKKDQINVKVHNCKEFPKTHDCKKIIK